MGRPGRLRRIEPEGQRSIRHITDRLRQFPDRDRYSNIDVVRLSRVAGREDLQNGLCGIFDKDETADLLPGAPHLDLIARRCVDHLLDERVEDRRTCWVEARLWPVVVREACHDGVHVGPGRQRLVGELRPRVG